MSAPQITTAEAWREFLKRPGAKAECESPSWLVGGCPRCSHPVFEVTSDGWVYCTSCGVGHSTHGHFTRMGRLVDYIDVSSGTPVWIDDAESPRSPLEETR